LSSALARSRKTKVAHELICERVYRPLAHLVVLVLLPLRVPPPFVAAAAGATGIAAAVQLAQGRLLLAAILVQAKTVLDNADGQLARLSGRVTVFGRYLDSELDLLVNAALFAGVAVATGKPALAARRSSDTLVTPASTLARPSARIGRCSRSASARRRACSSECSRIAL